MATPTSSFKTPLPRLLTISVIISAPYICNGFQQLQQQTSRTRSSSSSSSSSSSLHSISSSSIRSKSKSSSSSSSSALNYYQEDNIHSDNIEVEDILLGYTTSSSSTGGGGYGYGSSSSSLSSLHTNEYDRDNEFYRRRNEEYYKQQQHQQQQKDAKSTPTTTTTTTTTTNAIQQPIIIGGLTDLQQQTQYHQQQYRNNEQNKDPREYWLINSINTSLKASHISFKHVENSTYELLTEKPLIALSIFFAAGLVVAYLIGFLFLDGYIESINPISNDIIPYWNDAEIHTIDSYY